MAERETGFYWIETLNGWEPALWVDNDWRIVGYDLPWDPKDIMTIGERLTPPGRAAYSDSET